MPYYTPLRYPGGKRRLAPLVMRLLEENGLRDVKYAEPYAGGAAIALALLFEEYASTIYINDLSRPIYAFWHTVLNRNSELCRRVERVKVTMTEWRKQRLIYERGDSADLKELGFAALFLNRTNRSGILSGGVIGGKKQTGEWSLDARFNKTEIINRIQRIGRYRSRINLHRSDGLKFTSEVVEELGQNAFVFYDPPYIENGADLYLNQYTVEGHRELAEKVSQLGQPWVVTYDQAAVRHNLYGSHRRIIYSLNYSAQKRYEGREVMFLSERLKLPFAWPAFTPVPLSSPGSNHPLYGMIETMGPQPAMDEGPQAFERFRKAIKTIVAVKKSDVAPQAKPRTKKKPVNRKKPT